MPSSFFISKIIEFYLFFVSRCFDDFECCLQFLHEMIIKGMAPLTISKILSANAVNKTDKDLKNGSF